MNKKYQVFVSSTYEDLKDERMAVISGLLDMNCIPVGMEQFPASSLSQWEYIKKMIDMSDYYVLIVAGKYGSIDPESKISYTEKEYNYAKSINVPILAFLYEDIDKLIAKDVDSDRTHIEIFRQEVSTGRLVKFYSNVDDLKSKVITSMHQAISSTPRPGWIRADKLNDNQEGETNSQNPAMTKEEFENMFNQELSKHIATDEEVEDLLNGIFKQELSKEAKQLLIEASKDIHGCFWVIDIDNGTCISTNGVKMNKEYAGKEVAIWKNAVKELLYNELATLEFNSLEKYIITPKGYDVAKQLISST